MKSITPEVSKATRGEHNIGFSELKQLRDFQSDGKDNRDKPAHGTTTSQTTKGTTSTTDVSRTVKWKSGDNTEGSSTGFESSN